VGSSALGVTPVAVAGTGRTAFHTATLLPGDLSVLMTGGFELLPGENKQPPAIASAVRIVSVSDAVVPTVSAVNVSAFGTYAKDCGGQPDQRYRPAGFEAATAIHRGRVLITGGSPSTTAVSSRCQDCTGSLLCAIPQVSIFTAQTSSIDAAQPLQVARLGHSSTLLADGTVLMMGGIGGASGSTVPVFVGDIEVYNPRDAVPPFDVRMGGVDADDPIARDLLDSGLERAPGKEAVSPDHPDSPVSRCGSL
jgi:hypothetical protein